MATLKVKKGPLAGQVVCLDDRECLIGRDKNCQLAIPSRAVSRHHARVVHESDGYYVEDLHSVNGTAVNGRKIDRRTLLQHRDRIQLHNTELRFYSHDDEPVVQETDHDLPDAGHTGIGSDDSRRTIAELTLCGVDQGAYHDAERKLEAILKISEALGSSLDLDVTLDGVLGGLFDVFPQAERAYILQTDPRGELRLTAMRHRGSDSDTVSPVSNAIARRVMEAGGAFLSSDVTSDDRLAELSSSVLDAARTRSIMCAPLMGPSRTAMGVIQLETSDPRAAFTPRDLGVLASAALLAGQFVEYTHLHRSLIEVDARRRERALAKEVQLRFLPSAHPQLPAYKFYHYYHAADEVAGDYYDYIELPDGRLAIAQGDVSGKGVAAALLTARLGSDIRYGLTKSSTPAAGMALLNQQLCQSVRSGSFVTLILSVLDPVAHRVTFVNAGHPPLVVRRHGATVAEAQSELQSGIPLGIDADYPYRQHELLLDEGDLVMCYTDGLSEARNVHGHPFSADLICRIAGRAQPDPVHVGAAILDHLRKFTQGRPHADDLCFVCWQRLPVAAPVYSADPGYRPIFARDT